MGSYSAVGVCDQSFDLEAVGVPADAHWNLRPPQSGQKDLPAHEGCGVVVNDEDRCIYMV